MSATPPVPKHLNFITGNKNKLAEVQAILAGVIELQNQSLDLIEIQGTVEEVTLDKCRRAADAVSFSHFFPKGMNGWGCHLISWSPPHWWKLAVLMSTERVLYT